jgi:hypothetical protein
MTGPCFSPWRAAFDDSGLGVMTRQQLRLASATLQIRFQGYQRCEMKRLAAARKGAVGRVLHKLNR